MSRFLFIACNYVDKITRTFCISDDFVLNLSAPQKHVALIETVNDELKNIGQIEHIPGFENFLINLLSGLIAYLSSPRNLH